MLSPVWASITFPMQPAQYLARFASQFWQSAGASVARTGTARPAQRWHTRCDVGPLGSRRQTTRPLRKGRPQHGHARLRRRFLVVLFLAITRTP